ncbi:AI-2E family transporter, partial [Acinetobacter baumannii]
YFGREVLVPIALAALLSFVLAPAVRLLQGWRLGRGPAVVAVVALAFTVLFGLTGVMVREIDGLARDLPSYEATMLQKIETLRGAALESR